MRSWITNCALLGLSIALLVHFASIIKYKQVIIQEPNLLILGLEIAGLLSLVILGISNLVKLAREGSV